MTDPIRNYIETPKRRPGLPPRCMRQLLTDAGYQQCRYDATVEYLVDPDGGLGDRPRAYHCERHRFPPSRVPRGYIARPVR